MGTFQFIMVLIIILCVILVLVILSQNPKGGGLSSTFGGSGGGQMFGVQRTNAFLDRATWTIVATIVVLCVAANVLRDNPNAVKTSKTPTPIEQSAPPQE